MPRALLFVLEFPLGLRDEQMTQAVVKTLNALVPKGLWKEGEQEQLLCILLWIQKKKSTEEIVHQGIPQMIKNA
eukprot:5240763-Amphidinium_carterae.1